MVKFDLHLHSNNSDGSDSVEELLKKVINANIKIFSLTDHDTVAGISEIIDKIPLGIHFINGVELTCAARNIKCHILGYNIDPNNKRLCELIKQGKLLRKKKLETRIKFLHDTWNINLTNSELEWLYSRESVVKTHIANILVKRGLSDNNVDAMKKYLDNCKTGNTRFDGEDAIKTIKESGGIPIWAHPLGGEGEIHLSKEEFLSKLEIMIECGIQGLECYYSRYNNNEVEFLRYCADKFKLYVSGGSDYHGINKTVSIGRLNIDDKPVDSKNITILSAMK